MRKRSVFVIVGLAATIATSARAEVNLTHKNAALKGMHKVNAPTGTGGGGLATVSLVDGSGLEWFLDTNITTATASSASGAASDANYTQAVAASTSLGGTVPTALDDAFDGYNGLAVGVNGGASTSFNLRGPASTTCFGSASQVNREFLFDAQLVGPVSVRRRVFVPENDAFARWVDVFTNTGTSVANVTISTANNLGSDAGTTIDSSSSGDAVATVGDTWVTTFEAYGFNAPAGQSSDPRIGHVLQGAGAPSPVTSIVFANGNGNPTWGYNLTLAPKGSPGDSASIVNFATGQPSRTAARTQAGLLANFPAQANTTDCMSPNEVAEVANFATPATTELVTNGSFEYGGTTYHPAGWDPNEIGDGSDDGVYCEPDGTATPLVGGTNAVDGTCFFRIRGEGFGAGGRTEEGYKYIRQTLPSGTSGNFTLSAWAKSSNASFTPKKKFQVVATFKRPGNRLKRTISFTRGTHDWELKQNNFNVNFNYTKAIVEVEFFGQGPQGNNQPTAGIAWFDGVSLVQN